MEAERLLTVAQVAELWQCSEMFVRRLCWSGELRHQRFGRLIRIPQTALDDYLALTSVDRL